MSKLEDRIREDGDYTAEELATVMDSYPHGDCCFCGQAADKLRTLSTELRILKAAFKPSDRP